MSPVTPLIIAERPVFHGVWKGEKKDCVGAEALRLLTFQLEGACS